MRRTVRETLASVAGSFVFGIVGNAPAAWIVWSVEQPEAAASILVCCALVFTNTTIGAAVAINVYRSWSLSQERLGKELAEIFETAADGSDDEPA